MGSSQRVLAYRSVILRRSQMTTCPGGGSLPPPHVSLLLIGSFVPAPPPSRRGRAPISPSPKPRAATPSPRPSTSPSAAHGGAAGNPSSLSPPNRRHTETVIFYLPPCPRLLSISTLLCPLAAPPSTPRLVMQVFHLCMPTYSCPRPPATAMLLQSSTLRFTWQVRHNETRRCTYKGFVHHKIWCIFPPSLTSSFPV